MSPIQLIERHAWVSEYLQQFNIDQLMQSYDVPQSWTCTVDHMTPMMCALWCSHEEALDYLVAHLPLEYCLREIADWQSRTLSPLPTVMQSLDAHIAQSADSVHSFDNKIVPECWLRRMFLINRESEGKLRELSGKNSSLVPLYRALDVAKFSLSDMNICIYTKKSQGTVYVKGYHDSIIPESDWLVHDTVRVMRDICRSVWSGAESRINQKIGKWLSADNQTRKDFQSVLKVVYGYESLLEVTLTDKLQDLSSWFDYPINIEMLQESITCPADYLEKLKISYQAMIDLDLYASDRAGVHQHILALVLSAEPSLIDAIYPSPYASSHERIYKRHMFYHPKYNFMESTLWEDADELSEVITRIDDCVANRQTASPR